MIRVGTGTIRILLNPASNDMSQFFPSEYVIGDWFYMGLNDYMDKTEFERFNMNPDLPQKEVQLLIDKSKKGEEISHLESRWHHEMARLIKKAGGHLLWEYNVPNKSLDGWLRQCSALGEKRLKPWPWLDCYIKLPILQFWCRMLNKTLYFKRKKEWAEWENFLNDIHKEKK